MKKIATLFTLIAAAFVLAACSSTGSGQREGAAMQGATPPAAQGAMQETTQGGTKAIYWCGTPEGPYTGISISPANCPEGTPRNEGHVLRIEGTTALVCACSAGCQCTLDPKDPGTCACGKPIRRINLAGTGIWFCGCGAGCDCNTLSDKPGKCRCGMQLQQAK
jgi:hypothetical protein